MYQQQVVTTAELYKWEICFGLLAFLDALVRRPKSLGGMKQKMIWMVVTLGMAFTSWITFIWVPAYFLITYVQRQHRKGYRAGGFGTNRTPVPNEKYKGAGNLDIQGPCTVCGGNGQVRCTGCNGGFLWNPETNRYDRPHFGCTRGWTRCTSGRH